jgi:CRISPR/Cas system-associated exonuclease Cas4 (RecB family)
MRIESNSEMGKVFAERILGNHYARTSTGRKGWHRSDAIVCPLEAYWRITGEVKGEFRAMDVGIVMIGEMGHKVLEEGFDAKEKVFTIAGVQVTIDAIHGTEPVEIKTTRKQIYTKDAIPKDWVEQLAIGMSVMDVNKGYLMIINIINTALLIFEFTMSAQERELTRNTFIWQIMNIADAIEKKNPNLLKPRYEDCHWCHYRPSKENRNCPYYKKIDDKKTI